MPSEPGTGRVAPVVDSGNSTSSSLYEVLTATYPERSCFVFSKRNAVRKACVLVSHNKLFEGFIFFVILCNCVTLALSSNRQDFDGTALGKALAKTDYAFIAIFTLEMVLKIISMGFVLQPGSYLRDGWNVLDFVVVSMSYLSLVLPNNLTGIRTVRALRPLRTINKVKAMKVLVNTLLGSLPMLLDVFCLCAFTFFMFGIIAVQLFAGALRYRCAEPDFSGALNASQGADGRVAVLNVTYLVPDDQADTTCSGPLSSEVVWYLDDDGQPLAYPGSRYAGRACPPGLYCTLYGNPYDGFVSFDNILWAWLTIFQDITLSGWSEVMYWVMDAVNYWTWLFFVGLIIFGAFFMVNLALAVLSMHFSADNLEAAHEEAAEQDRERRIAEGFEAAGREEAAEAEAGGKAQADIDEAAGVAAAAGAAAAALTTAEAERSGAASGQDSGKKLDRDSDPGRGAGAPGGPGDADQRDKQRQEPGARQWEPGEGGRGRGGKGSAEGEETPASKVAAKMTRSDSLGTASGPPPAHLGPLRRACWRLAASKGLEVTTAALILVNTAVMCVNWYGMPYSVERATNYINYALTVYFLGEVTVRLTALGFRRFFSDGMNWFDLVVVIVSLVEMVMDLVPSVSGVGPLSVLRAFRLLRLFRLARNWRELNNILSGMVRSVRASAMLVLLLVLFLFIAALVGMQLFGYKFMFCDYVEGASPVCPPGQAVWGQCPDHFHCYLPCTADQYDNWIDAPGSFYNGLAYCQRFCEDPADAAAADAAAAATAAGNSSSALVAGDGAAAAAGGGSCSYLAMVGKSQVPRAHFDNVFWAIFTVFQVVTGDGWNDVMVTAMQSVSDWASLYFVGVIVIGNYLVFNLFIAILLDNLSSKMNEEEGETQGSRSGSDGGSRTGSDSGSFHPPGDGPSRRGSMSSTAAIAAGTKGDKGEEPISIHARTAAAESPPGSDGGSDGGKDAARAALHDKVYGDSAYQHGGAGAADGELQRQWRQHEATDGRRSRAAAAAESAAPTDQEGGASDAGGAGSGGGDNGQPQGNGLPASPRAPPPLPPLPPLHPNRLPPLQSRPPPVGAGAAPTATTTTAPAAAGVAGPVGEASEAGPGTAGRDPAALPPAGNGRAERAQGQQQQQQQEGQSGAGPSPSTSNGGESGGSSGGGGADPHKPPRPPGPRSVSFAVLPNSQPSSSSSGAPAAADSVPPPAASGPSFLGGPLTRSETSLARIPRQQSSRNVLALATSLKSLGGGGGGGAAAAGAAPSSTLPLSATPDSAPSAALTLAPAPAAPPPPPAWHSELHGRSLLLFPPHSRVRHLAARTVFAWWFEAIIMTLIIASCVCLVLDAPDLNPDSTLAVALKYLDYCFTAAFTIEALLKIVVWGFVLTGRHAYLRDGWNVLDFTIVLLGYALIIVDLVGVQDASDLKMLRVLRALRALRPLRAVRRFDGLRTVVNALFAVLPAMGNVALVCGFFYLIFAILSVNLFKGTFYACLDADSGDRVDPFYVLPPGQTLTRGWCLAGQAPDGPLNITANAYYAAANISGPEYQLATQWTKPLTNFDNVGIAFLTLFQAATLAWTDITFLAVDATGEGRQPLWDHRPAFILYFVAFIVICSFFVLNLFIGVTLEKFAELHEQANASSVFLTPGQQNWVDVQRLMMRTRVPYRPPRPARGVVRQTLYDIVVHRGFDGFMMGVILVNVMFMAMVHADMSPAWQDVMTYSNLVFTAIFVVEATLKLAAFSPLGYLRDSWNCFDLFVVAVSVASVVLDFVHTKNLSFMPVLRVLRVARVFRLIRSAKGMQMLLSTVISSLPALTNVGGVMLVFFFVFAVIGVNLFAGVKRGDSLNDHSNFDNFPSAMLTLFSMVTGDGWDGLMQDCMSNTACVLITTDTTSPATNTTLLAGTYLDPGDPALAGLPDSSFTNQCPLSPAAAVVYFPAFVLLCSFILLQLVIAVLLENLMQADADAELPVSKTSLETFVNAWGEADGARHGVIHASQLMTVLQKTEPPLGVRGAVNQRQAAQQRLFKLDIPLYGDNTVCFMDALHMLAGSVCAVPLPPSVEQQTYAELSRRVPVEQPHERYTAAHYHAADSVRAAIRGFLLRYQYRDQLEHPGIQRLLSERALRRQNSTSAAAAAAATKPPDHLLSGYENSLGGGGGGGGDAGAKGPRGPPLRVDSDMIVNGHRLGDLRRELAAGSMHTPPAPRRLGASRAVLPPILPRGTRPPPPPGANAPPPPPPTAAAAADPLAAAAVLPPARSLPSRTGVRLPPIQRPSARALQRQGSAAGAAGLAGEQEPPPGSPRGDARLPRT